MVATKRPVGVAPEVNLGIPHAQAIKHLSERIYPGFETQEDVTKSPKHG